MLKSVEIFLLLIIRAMVTNFGPVLGGLMFWTYSYVL